jgi:hypothetical protein
MLPPLSPITPGEWYLCDTAPKDRADPSAVDAWDEKQWLHTVFTVANGFTPAKGGQKDAWNIALCWWPDPPEDDTPITDLPPPRPQ